MTASPSASPATNAVEAWQPKPLSLDAFPSDQYNRLIPTQTIMQVSPYLKPVLQVVTLDVARDTYESRDLPNGHRALNRVGLRKLAATAGVSFLDERRTDDGSNPDEIEVSVVAEMPMPTGQRIRATGMKRVRLADQTFASDAQRKRYKSTFQEHVASRAQHRAIRALLSLQQSYPVADLQKPFVVATFVLDMSHPDLREAAVRQLMPTVDAVYGAEASTPRAIGSGPALIEATAPDDDVTDGQYKDLGDGRTADRSTGEISGDAQPDPEWFGVAGSTTDSAAPSLIEQLRAMAAKNADDAPAGDKDRERMRSILAPLGLPAVKAVLAKAFELPDLKDITQGQAGAVLELSAQDDFAQRWSKAAEA